VCAALLAALVVLAANALVGAPEAPPPAPETRVDLVLVEAPLRQARDAGAVAGRSLRLREGSAGAGRRDWPPGRPPRL
jgi:hypothetical protein